MSEHDSHADRLGSLTPEERLRIFDEERRRIEREAADAAPQSSVPGPSAPTGEHPRVRRFLTGTLGASITAVALVIIGGGIVFSLSEGGETRRTSTAATTPTVRGLIDTTPATPTEPVPPPEPERTVGDIQLTAMQENNTTFTVKTDFVEDARPITLRVEGKEYPVEKRDGTSYVFSNVTVPIIGTNSAKLVLGTGEGLPPSVTLPFLIKREVTTLDEWRKYAENIDYKRLAKGADKYAGKLVKGQGKIYQITEDSGMTTGGINVTPKGYGYWDDNVRFTMVGTTDFVQDDTVRFYGHVVGDYTYETTAGWNLTVPAIIVDEMER